VDRQLVLLSGMKNIMVIVPVVAAKSTRWCNFKMSEYYYIFTVIKPEEAFEPILHVEGRTDDKQPLDKVEEILKEELSNEED